MQVFRRRFGAHAAVNESNEIGQIVVAEKSNHFAFAALKPPGRIQLRGIFRVAGGVAPESDILCVRPRTPSSVANHRNPRSAAISSAWSETEPSDGHSPTGGFPKVRS